MGVRILSRVQRLWRQRAVASHTRDVAGSTPAGATGVSPNGRAAVLQTADVSSILSTPTMVHSDFSVPTFARVSIWLRLPGCLPGEAGSIPVASADLT